MKPEYCDRYTNLYTIGDLFNRVRIQHDFAHNKLSLVKVIYDKSYYYPKQLFYSFGDSYGDDDADYYIEVNQFTPNV
jgi:hypothetical protein